MNRIFAKLSHVVLFLTVVADANAESLFSCKYPVYSSNELKIEKDDNFNLQFVLREDGTASMIGNQGAAPVLVFQQRDQITFLEITQMGNFMLTTVDKKGESVHSRHTVISSDLFPSQYYGYCKVQ